MLTGAKLAAILVAATALTASPLSASPDPSQPAEPRSPSGATTSVPFAPVPLSSSVPTDIDGVEIIAWDLSPDEVLDGIDADPHVREMLVTAGRAPADVHMAEAISTAGPGSVSYRIDLLRIDGMDGRDALGLIMAARLWREGVSDDPVILADFADALLATMAEPLEGGQEVFVLAEQDATTFTLAYPHGEVLYVIDAAGGLAAADLLAAARFGGVRIEAGDIAVTAPRSWTVELTAPATHGWLYSSRSIDGSSVWSGVAYLHDAEFDCAVIDATPYARELGLDDLADAIAWETAAFADGAGDQRARLIWWLADEPSDVVSEIVELPAGPTGVIDATDPGWWNSRTYILTDGARWVYLHCTDTFEPPDDDWLSIAETFEFLPS